MIDCVGHERKVYWSRRSNGGSGRADAVHSEWYQTSLLPAQYGPCVASARLFGHLQYIWVVLSDLLLHTGIELCPVKRVRRAECLGTGIFYVAQVG